MDASDPRRPLAPGARLDPTAWRTTEISPRAATVPVPRTSVRSARALARPTGPDPKSTLRKLKGVAIVAIAFAATAFGALVLGHPVGTTTAASRTAAGGSTTGPATGAGQTAAPVDPFFDSGQSQSGSGVTGGNVPAFGPGFGSGGGGPVLQSGGS